MVKRFLVGLVKGLVIGSAVGAGIQYGLEWTSVAGPLGYLIAMGAGGTTGIFAGRPPWQEGAWIEGVLKGMVGVGLGALAYWGLTYVPFEVPYPGLAPTEVSHLPMLFAPLVAGTYGAMVELDNTGSAAAGAKAPPTRVALGEVDVEEVGAAANRKRQRKAS